MKSDLRTVAQEVESANVDNQDYTLTHFAGAKAPLRPPSPRPAATSAPPPPTRPPELR